jgi:phenylpropionate dioxygenase-like ring-hydroxylating dioxygenase large terminal subunit
MSTDWATRIRPDRVHRSLYTDPDVFDAEMTTLFGGSWTFLAHESEVPGPGDFVRKRLGRRPVIVTRDADGAVHALVNRCTHRGATVCRLDAGTATRFTCPYHGWTYSNTGALTGVPWGKGYRTPAGAMDRSELGLGRIRVASHRGFVFGTLDLDAPDLVDHLGPASDVLGQWIDRSPTGEVRVEHGAHRMEYAGNWKLAYDNSADGYHPGFSHRSLLTMRQEQYGEGVDMQYVLADVDAGAQTVTDLGRGNTFLDQRGEIPRYWPQAAPSPGREGYEAVLRGRLGDAAAEEALEVAVGSGMNINLFPNLLIIGNQLQVIEPLAVNRTRLTWYATSVGGVPEEITAIRMRLQEDFPSFGEPDDLVNFEECQDGLSVPEMDWVMTHRHLHTGASWIDARTGLETGPVSDELPIRAFWRRWQELMSADLKLAVT